MANRLTKENWYFSRGILCRQCWYEVHDGCIVYRTYRYSRNCYAKLVAKDLTCNNSYVKYFHRVIWAIRCCCFLFFVFALHNVFTHQSSANAKNSWQYQLLCIYGLCFCIPCLFIISCKSSVVLLSSHIRVPLFANTRSISFSIQHRCTL